MNNDYISNNGQYGNYGNGQYNNYANYGPAYQDPNQDD